MGEGVKLSNGSDGLLDLSFGVKKSAEGDCLKNGLLLSQLDGSSVRAVTHEEIKQVATDDLVSANAHYTLEDFFSNYDDANDTVNDIFETGLDFSKLSGTYDDLAVDTSFEPLINLVKCDVWQEDVGKSLLQKTEMLSMSLDVLVQRAKPKTKNRKSELPRAPVMNNDRKADYGANDTIDNICDLEWHPGFTRHLGAKGRSALLELVRRVYRQDPTHYKAILQARNPPSSISNLPFFSIPMLWELTHQFGIFKDALLVYRNNCFSKSKNKSKQNADNNAVKVTTKTEPAQVIRSAKRPKKNIDYSSIVRNSDGVIESSKNEEAESNNDASIPRISSNVSVNDEIAFKLLDNEENANNNEKDMEAPLLWKLSMVPNRHNNCIDYTDERIINNKTLNRRISV